MTNTKIIRYLIPVVCDGHIKLSLGFVSDFRDILLWVKENWVLGTLPSPGHDTKFG